MSKRGKGGLGTMREYKDWGENLQWGRRKWLRTWKGNRGNSHKIQETQAKLAIKSVEKKTILGIYFRVQSFI